MTSVSSAGGAGGAGGWVIRSVSTWTRLEAGDNDDDCGFAYTHPMTAVSSAGGWVGGCRWVGG